LLHPHSSRSLPCHRHTTTTNTATSLLLRLLQVLTAPSASLNPNTRPSQPVHYPSLCNTSCKTPAGRALTTTSHHHHQTTTTTTMLKTKPLSQLLHQAISPSVTQAMYVTHTPCLSLQASAASVGRARFCEACSAGSEFDQ
jgi:hypothetical protein